MQWGEQGANGHPRRRRDFPNIFNPNGNRIFFRFKNLLFNVPVFVRILFYFILGVDRSSTERSNTTVRRERDLFDEYGL
jgi:hypothetical protein